VVTIRSQRHREEGNKPSNINRAEAIIETSPN